MDGGKLVIGFCKLMAIGIFILGWSPACGLLSAGYAIAGMAACLVALVAVVVWYLRDDIFGD